jgi:hypothetical protein
MDSPLVTLIIAALAAFIVLALLRSVFRVLNWGFNLLLWIVIAVIVYVLLSGG